MGRPRQGKNKINEDKEKLIKTVRDDNQEFLEFSVSIPSREEMINENFRITEFNVKCSEVDLLRQNLVDVYDSKMDTGIDGKELIHAWNNLYHEGLLKHQFFLVYSPGNQVRFMELMLKDIDESKRSLRYKKWKFALRERQRRRLLESTSEEIDTSSGEERTSEEVSEEIDTSFGEERTSEEVKDVMHKTRVIEFNGRSTSIILQEDNGPCPLLAICNVLLLRNELELSEDTTEISQKFLLSFVHELIKSKNNNKDAENIDDVIPRLATGIDVDITFNGITEFESTRERGVI